MVKTVENRKTVTEPARYQMMFFLNDRFNSPECAKILINCLKSIELQAKEPFVLHEDTKNSQVKGKKQLNS